MSSSSQSQPKRKKNKKSFGRKNKFASRQISRRARLLPILLSPGLSILLQRGATRRASFSQKEIQNKSKFSFVYLRPNRFSLRWLVKFTSQSTSLRHFNCLLFFLNQRFSLHFEKSPYPCQRYSLRMHKHGKKIES